MLFKSLITRRKLCKRATARPKHPRRRRQFQARQFKLKEQQLHHRRPSRPSVLDRPRFKRSISIAIGDTYGMLKVWWKRESTTKPTRDLSITDQSLQDELLNCSRCIVAGLSRSSSSVYSLARLCKVAVCNNFLLVIRQNWLYIWTVVDLVIWSHE